MRKAFNLLIAMFAIWAVCVACSKGNDEPENSTDTIVGKWECVKSEGWQKTDDEITDEWNEPNTGWGWIFNKDGTGYNYETGCDDLKINWSIDQDKITIAFVEDGYDTEVYTIESLSADKLELSLVYTWNNTEAGSQFKTTGIRPSVTRIKIPDSMVTYEKLTFRKKN